MVLLLCAFPLLADTVVKEDISANQIFTREGSPYIITGNLLVFDNTTLTIQPGTILRMKRNASIEIKGQVIAEGSETDSIKIIADDERSTTPSWASISLKSKNYKSTLKYVLLQGGGNHGHSPVEIVPYQPHDISKINFQNCRYNGLEIIPGGYDEPISLNNTDLCYFSLDWIIANSLFEISGPIIWKFAKRKGLEVNGEFLASGLPGDNIIFTAMTDDESGMSDTNNDGWSTASRYDWAGIIIGSKAMANISFIEMKYGGMSPETENSVILVDGGKLKMESSTIANCGGHGITAKGNNIIDLGLGEFGSKGRNTFFAIIPPKYAVSNKSSADISANGNCWGFSDQNKISEIIYDNDDNKSSGNVSFDEFFIDCSPQPPNTIICISPMDSTRNISINSSFRWNSDDLAEKYILEISEDSTFSHLFDNITLTDTTHTINNLYHGTIYFWRVKGVNLIGDGNFSNINCFRTIDTIPPEKITLSNPVNGIMAKDCDVTLSWETEISADFYSVQLAYDEEFQNIINDSIQTTSNSFIFINLPQNSEIFWRVKGTNQAGSGKFSDVRSLETKSSIIYSEKRKIEGRPVASADINNDSIDELIFIDSSNVSIYDINSYEIVTSFDADMTIESFYLDDLDYDGLLDIILSGTRDKSNYFTGVAMNCGNSFNSITYWMPGLKESQIMSIDIDSDFSTDIFVIGKEVSYLFKNYGNGYEFAETIIQPIGNSTISKCDYDCDGYQDIIISGENPDGIKSLILYDLDKETSRKIEIANSYSKHIITDINSDGYEDIAAISDTSITIFINNNSQYIIDTTYHLNNCIAYSYDFDGNGSEEILATSRNKNVLISYNRNSFVIKKINQIAIQPDEIFISNIEDKKKILTINKDSLYIYDISLCGNNLAPDKPVNLRYNFSKDDIIIQWERANDTESHKRTISYLISIGSTQGSSDYAKNINTKNNFLRIAKPNSGKYFWRVAAIDNFGNISDISDDEIFLTEDMIEGPPESWSYASQTGENQTIILRKSAFTQINGRNFADGDAVGIFYNSADSLACGGYAMWQENSNIALTAWGDNQQTIDIKDGFEFAENFRFFLWDSRKQLIIPVIAEFETARKNFKPDTITVISLLKNPEIQEIPIEARKWTLVSGYIEPIENKFSDLSQNSTFINHYDSGNYTRWESNKGYWVYSESPDTIRLSGWKIDEDKNIFLEKGWNIMPVYIQQPVSFNNVIQPIKQKILLAIDDNGNICYPDANINSINQLVPGNAYKIYMKEYAKISQDGYDATNITDSINSYYSTANSAYLIFTSDYFDKGDSVIVLYQGDVLAGSKFVNNHCVMEIRGDDFMTENKIEGPKNGDELAVYIISSDGTQYSLNNIIYNNLIDNSQTNKLTYGTDIIYKADILPSSISSINEEAYRYTLIDVLFSDNMLNISMKKAGNIDINIYSIDSKLIYNKKLDGSNEYHIDMSEFNSGQYFYKIRNNHLTKHGKLLIIK